MASFFRNTRFSAIYLTGSEAARMGKEAVPHRTFSEKGPCLGSFEGNSSNHGSTGFQPSLIRPRAQPFFENRPIGRGPVEPVK